MKKVKLKHILISAVVILAFFFFHLLYTGHHGVFNSIGRKYIFLYKDSIINKVNTVSNFSWVADQDILNHYIYYEDLKNKRLYYEPDDTSYNNYYFVIWEFKTLKNYNLEDVFINTHSIIPESKFIWGETLNSKSYCPISIKYLYKIDGLILNLDENSKVLKELHGKNYKGFFGLVNKMSICNKKGEPQIYFNFAKSQHPTVLLFYKGHNGFYLIMINSRKKIDENIIKILNLD